MRNHDLTGPLAIIGGPVTWLIAHFTVNGFLSGLLSALGIAYTLWRWRRESRAAEANPVRPFRGFRRR